MDLGLSGRVVLVVGGAGYIGRQIARTFVEEGAVVVLGGRSPEKLVSAAAEVGAAGTVVVDTRDAASASSAVDEVVTAHGRLDVLVNTAAPSAGTLDPARDRDAEQVLDAIDGKAMGYLRVTEAAVPVMRAAGFGRIIQISGQNAWLSGSVTAAARNAVVNTSAKAIADELAGSGVTVNVVNPGNVKDAPGADVALGRGGESSPTQIAALVAFLASDAAAAVSGESIAVGHRVRGIQFG
jgi:NAD(P)-dependent dehydrogenase (short-subunit alcohol dehydrogenase family)